MRIAALLLVAFGACSAYARDSVGTIDSIKGTVFYRAAGETKGRKLDARADRVRPLYNDDHLRSPDGGSVRVQLGESLRTITPGKGWTAIPPSPEPVAPHVARVLEDLGRIGGRPKSVPGAVAVVAALFSPAHQAAVNADELSLRWTVPSNPCRLMVELTNMDRKVLWQRNNVDAATSVIVDESLSAALRAERSSAERVRLEAKLTGECAARDIVRFELLSDKERATLKTELSRFDSAEHALWSILSRAAIYADYRLYVEAADAYEEALVLAPDSTQLLERTIAAHERTGNVARVNELVKRLHQAPSR